MTLPWWSPSNVLTEVNVVKLGERLTELVLVADADLCNKTQLVIVACSVSSLILYFLLLQDKMTNIMQKK